MDYELSKSKLSLLLQMNDDCLVGVCEDF